MLPPQYSITNIPFSWECSVLSTTVNMLADLLQVLSWSSLLLELRDFCCLKLSRVFTPTVALATLLRYTLLRAVFLVHLQLLYAFARRQPLIVNPNFLASSLKPAFFILAFVSFWKGVSTPSALEQPALHDFPHQGGSLGLSRGSWQQQLCPCRVTVLIMCRFKKVFKTLVIYCPNGLEKHIHWGVALSVSTQKLDLQYSPDCAPPARRRTMACSTPKCIERQLSANFSTRSPRSECSLEEDEEVGNIFPILVKSLTIITPTVPW